MKDGYKLELLTPVSHEIFGGTKKLVDITKTRENIPSYEVIEVVLVHCNLVDNQYQQKFEV